MENSRKISSGNIISYRLSCRDDPAKYSLEDGMETEDPGFFLPDPQLCRERYFRQRIFYGSAQAKRRIFYYTVSVWLYCVWCAAVCGVHVDPGSGNRTSACIVGSEFGLYGGLAGAGLLLPQYIIYVPAYFCLAGMVYRQSCRIWKNYGLVPAKNVPYIRKGITVFLIYAGGILAESFLNPWIVEKIIRNLKFF